MKRSRTLRNSTAVAMVLALGLTSPAHLAFAQDGQPQVNCEENPNDPSCVTPPQAEEPAPQPEPAPEQPTAEEPAPEAAPQAEEPAPEPAPQAEEPAPEPQAQEPAPEQPAAEEPAPEPAPQPEQLAPEPQAQEPAPEQPAAEEPAPEPAPQPEQPAPEPQAQEPAPEQPAAEEPAAEEPAPQPEAEQPAAEEPQAGEAAPEQPAAEQPQAETAQPEQPPAEETQAAEPAAQEQLQAEGATAETVEIEEPTLVIPDDATQEQRQQVEQQQKRRREEARDNRGELLGAAAVGAVIGALIPALGGKVVEDEGDRIIVERDGEYYVRKDESSLLRRGDAEVTVTRLRGGRTLETVTRRNGVVIETVRDEGGYVLRRTRILPDGREYVLIDNRDRDRNEYVDWDRRLPPIRVDIPRDSYIVPARRASRQVIYETITAPPVERVEQNYTLRDVRENERIRAKVRRVDLDTITFETGSAVVRQSQVPLLEDMAAAVRELIDQDPSAVVLVEGHTDAVGSETYNLALSDRRAETVAAILVDSYGIPPENLVTQGYGEQYLKVDTEQAEAQNRRATIRNITPLLSAQNQ
ncbi:MAG: flagellar motor protein MotB [Ahrensia sp.]|nr:flagellar motor protein MotB [Ahrensia sp.]